MTHKALLAFGDAPFERLIIGAGNHNRDLQMAPCNIGKIVTSQLLKVCGPPMSDVHDPSIANSRARNRDKYGINKEQASRIYVPSNAGGRSAPDNIIKTSGGRSQNWSSAPFLDFGGLFCDRLLCGSPPKRTAVFQPPALINITSSSLLAKGHVLGSGVENLLRHFPHIDSSDILVVCPTKGIPLGGMYLSTLRNVEKRGLVDESNLDFLHNVNNSLVRILATPDNSDENNRVVYDPTAGLAMSVLAIGVGGLCEAGGIPFQAPMSTAVSAAMTEYIIPKAVFTCGYWCANPPKASAFLSKDIALRSNTSSGTSHNSNMIPPTLKFTLSTTIFADMNKTSSLGDPFDSSVSRLATANLLRALPVQMAAWCSSGMFGALLSTRDEAILRAYEKGVGVSEPVLGVGKTQLIAESIIERIIKGGKST